jgi:hypothetical protein
VTHESWERFRDALERLPTDQDGYSGEAGWRIERGATCWLSPIPAEVAARLGADGRLETATLEIDRRDLIGAALPGQPDTSRRAGALDLIAQFLIAFPRRRSLTRVRLACTVGALNVEGGLSHEIAAAAPERLRLTYGVDEPQQAMLEVVAGRRWQAETIDLELANWHSASVWRMEVRFSRTGRFKFGRWSHEARVPWAEEYWVPHPTDGGGPAVALRRAVAACCVGDQSPEAASRALLTAAEGIEPDDPLRSFSASTHATLRSWASGELGAATALLRLGTALDEGSGSAWPATLRERIRKRVPLEFMPVEWAAEALDERATPDPEDLRGVARRMLIRAIIAEPEPDGWLAAGAAEHLAVEIRDLRADSPAGGAPQVREALARAEREVEAYLKLGTTHDELISGLHEALELLRRPPQG